MNTITTENKIKPGYKKTSVGIIPEDWEVKRFESITQDKGLIRGPFGGTLKKEIFVESGYKVYEQQNAIYKSSELGEYYITEEKFKELERFSVQIDNFIVSCSGTIGRIYRIPENFQKGIINQALLLIKINPKVIKYDFFNYIFESEVIQRKILEVQGGAMKNLVGMSEIRKVKFPIPPLPEQKAIADCLSTWDKAIEKLSALIASKKEQKKGLMQGLFSGKLKVENGQLIQAKDGEDFTKEWKEVKLGDISIKKTSNIQSGLLIENSGKYNVYGASGFITKIDTYDEEKPYIGIVKDGSGVGNTFLLEGKSSVLSTLDKILPKKNSNLVFLYSLIKKLNFEKYKVGGAIPHIYYKDYSKEKVLIPSIEEQTAIAEILQTADKEIELLEKQLIQLELQKKGLMQVLLTGERRLV